METAIATATAQTWRVKLALTLLAEADRGLTVAGAPATPQMPIPERTFDTPAFVLDFPSLIAARLMSVAKPTVVQPKKFGQTPKKRG